eukprot:XP_016657062.1 PREDICTED: kelch-like protein 2 [Acyrthosiphon pisum]
MFTNFGEKNKDHVVIRQLDSIILQLLVDFIYSGTILITKKNVQDLLAASNLLQLNDLKETCCEFFQKQLHPTNCLGIKAFADVHSCTKLLSSSELYIKQYFLKVVESEEFLSLSSEELVKLISCDELKVSSEEEVFESVLRWVKNELDSRKCFLPQLMEHVRLAFTSENYIIQKVLKEPILNNCLKCKEYINEVLHFHFPKRHESDQVIPIPERIRYKPRLEDKVILVVGGMGTKYSDSTEWYDPKVNQWKLMAKKPTKRVLASVAVSKDNLFFVVGGYGLGSYLRSGFVIDLFSESPSKRIDDMLVKRAKLGVGVINKNLYAVGGFDGTNCLNSAEVFDDSTKKWRMISSMSTRRGEFGVGVLNNLLYAVGGSDFMSGEVFNSVECYHPSLDAWRPVAEMCKRRRGVGVGVLDGVLYAVGGHDGSETLKSVEAYRPSTGVWTTMADMNLPRKLVGVVALEGLLHAVGGRDDSFVFNSVEVYNPITNTWTMLGAPMNVQRCCVEIPVNMLVQLFEHPFDLIIDILYYLTTYDYHPEILQKDILF